MTYTIFALVCVKQTCTRRVVSDTSFFLPPTRKSPALLINGVACGNQLITPADKTRTDTHK